MQHLPLPLPRWDLPSLALVWVNGRSAERLAGVRVPAGARKTTHLDHIWNDASVQAVLVLTPAHTHLDMVQRAARLPCCRPQPPPTPARSRPQPYFPRVLGL